MIYLQKAVIEIATESPDLYIMDRYMFHWIGQQGAFVNLDAVAAGELESLLSEENILRLQAQEDTEAHIYGIDLSNTAIVDDLPLYKQEMIVGIRISSENVDKAIQFIKAYLETSK